MRSIAKKPNHATGILFVIYALSFLLTAFGRGESCYGWQAFSVGLMYCWMLPWTIAWWANVFFWFGLFALNSHAYGRAAILGLSACLLGLSFLCIGGEVQAGYFLWIGSMVGLLINAVGHAAISEAEKSRRAPPLSHPTFGLESDYLRPEPCERIAAGMPNGMADLHIREVRVDGDPEKIT